MALAKLGNGGVIRMLVAGKKAEGDILVGARWRSSAPRSSS
jgi:hypothetical protein